MAISRLIGSDGELWAYTFGTPLVTGAATEGAEYKIVKIDGTTVFPAGYKVGDLWVAPSTPPTFSATNSAALATPALVGEITSFKFDFSKDAVEVTTLADSTKQYRAGKSDVTGTIEGITFVDALANGTSLANQFVRIVSISSTGTQTFYDLGSSSLWVKCFLQKEDSSGESQIWFAAQVSLLGYSFGAASGDAQSWSSDTRLLSDPLIFVKAIA
jgi:hypothetical protein